MVAESITLIIHDKIEDPCESSENNKEIVVKLNQTSGLYQAIKNQRLDVIKFTLQDKKFINVPLFTYGSLAGYTALHVACMETNADLVKMLIEEYHADVNIVAEDGTQPIHLACLFGSNDFVTILLAANANIEAEIERDVFLKYNENKIWCDDFGDKMTILTYAFLYNNRALAEILLSKEANVRVKSRTSKTLLMYALENNDHKAAEMIIFKANDTEYINARDDDGYYTLYYLLHPKKYGNFRYDFKQFRARSDVSDAIFVSLIKKPDIHATVNGNPNTLLLNMAAYRSSTSCLFALLPYYDHLNMSKALYYATLPPEDSQKMVRLSKNYDEQYVQRKLQEERKKSINIILKDLINRLAFGLSVPEEEKKLMDKLIANDEDIRELVHNYERNFIHGELKKIVIHYGNKAMTFYDFLLRSLDSKKLQLLVRDKIFMKAFYQTHFPHEMDVIYFRNVVIFRIDYANDRIRLLEKLKTVEHLRKAIPLSYECVLEIIDYLQNKDLNMFINSFFDI